MARSAASMPSRQTLSASIAGNHLMLGGSCRPFVLRSYSNRDSNKAVRLPYPLA